MKTQKQKCGTQVQNRITSYKSQSLISGINFNLKMTKFKLPVTVMTEGVLLQQLRKDTLNIYKRQLWLMIVIPHNTDKPISEHWVRFGLWYARSKDLHVHVGFQSINLHCKSTFILFVLPGKCFIHLKTKTENKILFFSFLNNAACRYIFKKKNKEKKPKQSTNSVRKTVRSPKYTFNINESNM